MNNQKTRILGFHFTLLGSLLCGCVEDQQQMTKSQQYGFGNRFVGGGRYIGSDPVITPDGKNVIFGSPRRTSAGDLYLFALDGGEFSVISDAPCYEGQPDMSPNGTLMAFVSECDGAPYVFLMNLDGTRKRRLTLGSSPEHSPRFSRDGKLVAFTRHLSARADDVWSEELYVANIESGKETRITSNIVADYPVDFTHDSRSIYYLSGAGRFNLRRRSLESDKDELIIALGLKGGGCCALSRDEKTVIFVDDREKPFFYEVFSCAIDGTQVRQLTHLNGYIGSVRLASWNESETVTFVLEPNRDGIGDIYMLGLRGPLRKIGANVNSK